MGNNFLAYVQQLEMLAFFSGYALVNYLVRFPIRSSFFKNGRGGGLVSILPFTYALMGTLYLGLQLMNLYPDYTLENITRRFQQPYLVIWALMSMLFWIPALAQRQLLGILHSLVFFFMIARDLFFQLAGFAADQDIVKNDMKIYTVSIFLNLAAFILLALFSYLPPFRKKVV
jgi:cyanate permease